MTKLLPELQDCVFDFGGFQLIKHPFVNTIYSESENAFYNDLYQQNSKRFDQLVDAGKYETALGLIEKPFRLDLLLSLCERPDGLQFGEDRFLNLLFCAYRQTECTHQNKDVWLSLMSGARGNRSGFMNRDDLASFNALPDSFTVYRGAIEGDNEDGISYTLNPDTAVWFAERFADEEHLVLEGTVNKEDVIGYSNARGEMEIIIDPEDFNCQKTYKLEHGEKPEMGIAEKVVLQLVEKAVAEPEQEPLKIANSMKNGM